jgi:uncharacterized protein (TIGR00299 family) protein
MSVRIAWFDCFSGISGDMTLAALVSAGWPFERLASLPGRLGLEGVRVTSAPARRGPFAALRVEVAVERDQPHRHLRHVLAALESGALEPAVREGARAVFMRLAEAEAAVHGTSVEKVHFHEVGAADALVDVVGAIEGLAELGVERVYASPPRLGGGTVQSEHGPIPVPAPATVELLRGVPVEMGPIPVELTTPTGAALLATLVASWEGPPAFRLERTGTGAGARDPKEWPNVLRVLIGTAEAGAAGRRRVAVLETALDDENPQMIGALVPRLIAAGALDAMVVPTMMKKGRPGAWLVVIAEPEAADRLADLILTESSSLGVRVRLDERYELERRVEQVETPFGPVALKVASLPGGGERAVAEFESVRAAAERAGRPLREVAEAAVAAWRARAGGTG